MKEYYCKKIGKTNLWNLVIESLLKSSNKVIVLLLKKKYCNDIVIKIVDFGKSLSQKSLLYSTCKKKTLWLAFQKIPAAALWKNNSQNKYRKNLQNQQSTSFVHTK